MSFILSDAHAQAAGASQGDPLPTLIMIGVLFLLMYFMILRPQSKRAKEHKQMMDALAKGDEVVTNGGVAGRVTGVGEQFVSLEVAQGVELKVQKHAIAAVLPKGTLKSAV
jgi:preprotein translocase subunit YajC